MATLIDPRFTRRQFLRTTGGILLIGGPLVALGACTPQDVEKIAQAFAALPDLVNSYRKQNNKPPIPLSDAMTAVALAHSLDLSNYSPEKSCPPLPGGYPDLHAWSSHGKWTAGCDGSNSNIMWQKPKEIAGYPDSGYEIAAGGGSQMTAKDALAIWKASKPHNDVMLNLGTWAASPYNPWKAIGAIVSGSYATAWFGTVQD